MSRRKFRGVFFVEALSNFEVKGPEGFGFRFRV